MTDLTRESWDDPDLRLTPLRDLPPDERQMALLDVEEARLIMQRLGGFEDLVRFYNAKLDKFRAQEKRMRDLCAVAGPGAVYTADVLTALNGPEATR